ncbi:MAG: methyltransferase domain-containing protein [Anaerolineae bacterium]
MSKTSRMLRRLREARRVRRTRRACCGFEAAPFDRRAPRERIEELGADEALEMYESQLPVGHALDLGTGDGDHALWLAARGYEVEGVDVDARALRRAELRARRLHLWLQTFQADARDFPILPDSYDLIVAAALLHFLPPDSLPDLASRIAAGLRPGGCVYASVLTTDDPGYAILRGSGEPEVAPNTFDVADMGIGPTLHYFGKGELRALFSTLDVVHYAEERHLRPGSEQGYNAAAVLLARKTAG